MPDTPPERPGYRKTILIAPASYKGSLGAVAAATALAGLAARQWPTARLDVCPIADGGDDTLAVLYAHDPGFQMGMVEVMGPCPDQCVSAQYLYHPQRRLAVLEAAQAHGLAHLLARGKLAPLHSTAYGVGQLIHQVLARHAGMLKTLLVSLGGSASTEGGLSALQALGLVCRDVDGQPWTAPLTGETLMRVHQVDWPLDWPWSVEIGVATDVDNPLFGPHGAAHVFAPQKGASPAQCAQLDAQLRHLGDVLTAASGQDRRMQPGAGAAGGLAYSLSHLPRVRLCSGADWVADQLDLHARIQQADCIITGEGCFDVTSLGGKATGRLLAWASGKPVWLLCGQSRVITGPLPDTLTVVPLCGPDCAPAEAMAHPLARLSRRWAQYAPTWGASCGLSGE